MAKHTFDTLVRGLDAALNSGNPDVLTGPRLVEVRAWTAALYKRLARPLGPDLPYRKRFERTIREYLE